MSGGARGKPAAPAASAASGARSAQLLEPMWRQWQVDWRWMQTIAERRGFEVTPLAIAKPAREAELARIEKKHGVTLAPQLRAVLLHGARRVGFGWRVPFHLQASERDDMPSAGGIRDAIWDLDTIDDRAIPAFASLAADLARRDRGEQPNTPGCGATKAHSRACPTATCWRSTCASPTARSRCATSAMNSKGCTAWRSRPTSSPSSASTPS